MNQIPRPASSWWSIRDANRRVAATIRGSISVTGGVSNDTER